MSTSPDASTAPNTPACSTLVSPGTYQAWMPHSQPLDGDRCEASELVEGTVACWSMAGGKQQRASSVGVHTTGRVTDVRGNAPAGRDSRRSSSRHVRYPLKDPDTSARPPSPPSEVSEIMSRSRPGWTPAPEAADPAA